MHALAGVTTIGRAGLVQIDDALMSGVHARFARTAAGMWFVEDCESKNGLFVGAKRVPRRVLMDGDVVRAGDTILLFERISTIAAPTTFEGVAVAAPSVELAELLERAAVSGLHVLLTGESGVGKELAAAWVHAASGRHGRLVAVNAGGLSDDLVSSQLFGHRRGAFTGAARDHDGLVMASSGGTLFLDEVGELSARAQVALLRTIEQREVMAIGASSPVEVDLRLVAATHVDLPAAVAQGTFREDLLARLSEWPISIPPLRQRRSDIPALIARFTSADMLARCTPDAVEALLTYSWPLNARELRTVTKRAAAMSREGVISLDHLPEAHASSIRERVSVAPAYVGRAHPTEEELTEALLRNENSIAAVAREYGKERRQIYRWLGRVGIRPDGPTKE